MGVRYSRETKPAKAGTPTSMAYEWVLPNAREKRCNSSQCPLIAARVKGWFADEPGAKYMNICRMDICWDFLFPRGLEFRTLFLMWVILAAPENAGDTGSTEFYPPT